MLCQRNVTREVNFVLYVMDLPYFSVSCMLVGCELNWEKTSNYMVYHLVMLAKVYSGLRSLTPCSSMFIDIFKQIGDL